MKIADERRTAWRYLCRVLCLTATAALPALAQTAQTPADQLKEAIQVFEQGQFEKAQEMLLAIDQSGLTDDGKKQRDDYADKVTVAINHSKKAQQDLDDGHQLYDGNKLDEAARKYQSVLKNNYASDKQKEAAEKRLALIQQKKNIQADKGEKAPAAPAAAEANVPATKPAAKKVAAAPTTQPAAASSDRGKVVTLVKQGEDAVRQGDFDAADRHFAEALRLAPDDADAVAGQKLVVQYRTAEGKPANLLTRVQAVRDLRWQRTERLAREREREIRELMLEHKFDDAAQSLQIARQTIESGKKDAEPVDRYTTLEREMQQLQEYLDKERVRYQEDQVAAAVRKATEESQKRTQRIQEEKDARIQQLMQQVVQHKRNREYDAAIKVLDEVLVIEPNHQRAREMRNDLDDLSTHIDEGKNYRGLQRGVRDVLVDAALAQTPPTELLQYPDRWPELVVTREPFGVGLDQESEQDRATRMKLDKVLPEVDFTATPFQDVVDFLRTTGQLSLDINWKALEVAGIDPTTAVTAKLSDVKLGTALRIILDNVGGLETPLDYEVLDGQVRISTLEDLNTKTVIRVYDIGDLLIEIRSFRNENDLFSGGGMMQGMMGGGMGGGMMGGGGFGGGGMGGGGNTDDDDSSPTERRKTRVESVTNIIKNQVSPGSWMPDGTVGSIDEINGKLIIRQTARAHRELAALLKRLRETKDPQVAVETRFIAIRNNFLEEIGVDLDVVLNNGTAGFDRVPNAAGTGVLTDPVTQAPLLLPRQYGQAGYYPAVPAGIGVPMGQAVVNQPYTNAAFVPVPTNVAPHSSQFTPIPILNNTLGMAQAQTTGLPGNLAGQGPAMQVFGSFLDNIQVDFLLRATQMDARSSVVQAPRLVLYNGQQSYISVSSIQGYISTVIPVVGGGDNTVAYRPVPGQIPTGPSLTVTVNVSGDRKYVTIEVFPRIMALEGLESYGSQVNAAGVQVGLIQIPRVRVTELRTTVTVPDEGTLLLGGLKQAGETEVEAGVPVLSKVPVLKRLYSNRSMTKDENVLLILIKPKIIIQTEVEEEAFPGLVERTGTSK